MESRPQQPPVRVYRTSRWPVRAVAGFFLAVAVASFVAGRAVVLLILFGAMGALFLFAGERSRVKVSSRGVTSVPSFGRSHTVPWSDIDGFVARRYLAKYSGWVVSMSAKGGWMELPATRHPSRNERSQRATEALAEQLNRELLDARRGG